MAIHFKPVQAAAVTGPRLGSGPLGSGGVGEPVGSDSGSGVAGSSGGWLSTATAGWEVNVDSGLALSTTDAEADAAALGEPEVAEGPGVGVASEAVQADRTSRAAAARPTSPLPS
jgi:hypothetical protein